MTRRSPGCVVGLVVLLGACARSGPDAATQPGAPSPGPSAAATAIPTATPTPTQSPTQSPAALATTTPPPAAPAARAPAAAATTILRRAVAAEPAARVALTPGAETVVHPAATFEVELSARASDARLVLVDARDDLVPASATREVGAGTRLTLAPAAPLVPGSRYALRLDGAADRELHDDAGRAFSAITLPLLAAGSPPPPEAKKKPGRKRRRH